jgi:two-component system cell cycle sensor histidine kinase/response regulator CckA
MKVNRIKELMKDFVSSGTHDDYDVETARKIMMINVVSVIGIINLVPLGTLAFTQGNAPLGFLDFVLASVLIVNLLYLRSSKNYVVSSYLGISFAGFLFVYLFVTGGQNNTGHLWYFTFPLFASFLLGSKRGAVASVVLLLPVIWLFATPEPSPSLSVYPTDFQVRFIPSFLVVLGYSYAFENIREKTQHKLTLKNVELRGSVTSLEKAQDALKTARDGLEQRVTERTAELTKAIEQLTWEVEERKRAEERLERINSCFLSFGANPAENIGSLTGLSGELLEATCALYNRLQGNLLCSIGQWNTPPDHNPQDKPDGHICLDVIQKAGDEIMVVRDLPNTVYAKTDPNVTAYNLKTYLGKAVKSGNEVVGSHCVVFQSDFVPTEQDRKVLQIAASAIGVEEERLGAVNALQESEERYRSFVDNIDLGVTLIDADHNIVMTNSSHGKMFNKPLSEFLGKKCFREFRKLGEVCPDCPGVKAMSIGQAARIETLAIRDDGTEFSARVHAFPTFGPDNTVTGFIEVVEDVTEQKRLEVQLQQAAKMESIGTLAGGIAHDFNNVLMNIQGRTSLMLLRMRSDHPFFEYLKGIEASIENASSLTKQLLGFAKGGKYEVKPTNLNTLINTNCEMFGQTRKEITIHTKYQREIWAVEVDQAQVEQVLLNLLVNAWQAMPDGGDLHVETSNVLLAEDYTKLFGVEPGNYVKLSVADTGVGMDEQTQQRIFDPFFTTKETMGHGTGLGLASAYGIIRNHSGIIDVYSEQGKGTTFAIYLPASGKEITIREDRLIDEILMGTETVLLVDDEDGILVVGEKLLKEMGYKVLMAAGGNKAIEVYNQNKRDIDIVILDMIMPDMGGGEVYDILKENNPEVKVLLASGYTVDGHASEILERGCNGFIQKPFKMRELSVKIREILEKK